MCVIAVVFFSNFEENKNISYVFCSNIWPKIPTETHWKLLLDNLPRICVCTIHNLGRWPRLQSFINRTISEINARLAAELQWSSKHDANSTDSSCDTCKQWLRLLERSRNELLILLTTPCSNDNCPQIKVSILLTKKHFTIKTFSSSKIRVCRLFQTPQGWENIFQAPHSWNTE